MRGFVRSFLVLGAIWGLYGLFLVNIQGSGTSYVQNNSESGVVAGATASRVDYKNVYIDEINSMRAIAGVVNVRADSSLLQIAELRSKDMVTRKYYAHESPDGMFFHDYFQDYGVRDTTYSCENLLLSTATDAATVVNEWMQSDSHRKCLLNPNMTTFGFSKSDFSAAASNEQLYVLILAQR
jgi:uncharacterized protein YkwD